MSEDVKPRKIWTSGFHLESTAGDINQKISIAVEELGVKSNVKGDRFFWIELEPTMRLMDELYDVINSIEICYGDAMYGHGLTEALKKYKKFKDGLR